MQSKHLGRIAVVCPSLSGKGAVANVALHHAEELAKRANVTLVSDSFPEDRLDGIRFVELSPHRFFWLRRFGHVPREVAFARAAKADLWRMARRDRLDLILCHGHAVATLTAKPLKQRFGVSYALVTHGDIFDRPKNTYDPRLTWFYRQVTSPAYRNADVVVALSPYMQEMAVRGGAVSERIVVIPNGIDPTEIGLDHSAPPPRKPTSRLELLYVGRLSVEKGVGVLVETAALLKARGVAFRLRIAGAGPEEPRLRFLVAKANLEVRVKFLGPVPRPLLGALYRSADVVCVPSRSDPFPTVVLEAMVSGAAIVGSNIGGIPSMVVDNVTGLLCLAGDPSALSRQLERFAYEPTLAQRMGTAGWLRATKQFDWRRIGNLLAESLLGVCGSAGKRAG